MKQIAASIWEITVLCGCGNRIKLEDQDNRECGVCKKIWCAKFQGLDIKILEVNNDR